jgi:DNA-binding beta-propeller fold protein YncE
MRPTAACLLCSLAVLFALPAPLPAQDEAAPQRFFARNLDNPCGIAIQPETGHIFVAEHRGVVRFYPQPQAQADAQGRRRRGRAMEIDQFPSDIYGKGPMYDIGPLGLAFIDATHLVVGDGSRPDGQELVRIYEVSLTPAERPAPESSAVVTLGPIKAGDLSAMGEGNFYGVALTQDALFVSCNGDDTKGWIARAEIKDGKFGALTPFIATKEAVGVDAPVPLTINKAGELVVGQMGEINVPNDSLLTIYDPKTGQLKATYETGLYDIAGLAYSPTTGKLYAVDFAWMAPTEGGLFELTISGDKCTARKIMPLDKPTAIAFDPQGNAYITAFGTAEEGATTKPGFVVRVGRNQL